LNRSEDMFLGSLPLKSERTLEYLLSDMVSVFVYEGDLQNLKDSAFDVCDIMNLCRHKIFVLLYYLEQFNVYNGYNAPALNFSVASRSFRGTKKC
jgi:hypothetical protein